MPVQVIVFDIDTDEVVQEFNSIKDASKFLRSLAMEKYGLDIKERHFSYKISHLHLVDVKMFETSGGVYFDRELVLSDIGVKLRRSFGCESCGKGQMFRPKTICGECYVLRGSESDSVNEVFLSGYLEIIKKAIQWIFSKFNEFV